MKFLHLTLTGFFLLLTACTPATIPVESVTVNQIVHENVQGLHESHKNLVRAYFGLKFADFERWFVEAYEPAYRRNYALVWAEQLPDEPFDPNNARHSQQYTRDMLLEYGDLAGQLRQQEEAFLAELDTVYAGVLEANLAVTELLTSASSLTQAQRELWDNTIGGAIPNLTTNRIDEKVEELQAQAQRLVSEGE